MLTLTYHVVIEVIQIIKMRTEYMSQQPQMNRQSQSSERRSIRLAYHSRRRGASKEVKQETVNEDTPISVVSKSHPKVYHSNLRSTSIKKEPEEFKLNKKSSSLSCQKKSIEG